MHHLLSALMPVVAVAALATGPVQAQDEARAAFVNDNLLAVFYHELGHALIDVLDLPVLGQEEDAADALSTILIDRIWEEESAVEMAYHTAMAYALYADRAETEGEEPAWHDVHAADLQRFYTHVCLFYGANPEGRADLAEEMGLPADRAETCEEEFDLAAWSWGNVLDGLQDSDFARGLRVLPGDASPAIEALIAAEASDLNDRFPLPMTIEVVVLSCGEANAYYDPERRRIEICTEFADDLEALWDAAS